MQKGRALQGWEQIKSMALPLWKELSLIGVFLVFLDANYECVVVFCVILCILGVGQTIVFGYCPPIVVVLNGFLDVHWGNTAIL